ncbi:Protein psi1 [Bienertia sinuspersici]
MDGDIEKSQDCYVFSGIRDFLKKYKPHHAKRQNDQHRHKVKPNDDCKTNHHAFDDDIFKASYNKKHDANNHLNGVEDQLKTMSRKKNNYENHNYYNGCFKAFILLSVPSKKKKVPSRVSSFDPSRTRSMEPEVERNLHKARSFEATPSLGRSKSINNSRNEQGMKSPTNSRAPSMLNRTTSTGSRTTSFNRTTSIGRSTSDTAAKARKMHLTRSGPLIMFSNSSGMLKPPATEKQLECTLEELYHGCVKKIKVSRDVYTFAGQKVQEEEVLTVNVKPGWKTGTKVTFPGTATDERPGEYVGDVIFVITEKQHPLFRRIEDDLELEIEVPLVDALTGCNLTIPLLGKEKMTIKIDDIVYPGYEKTFVGQGMPNQKEPHHKGDLKVKFLVEFPDSLTDEQRSEISELLSQ